MSELLSGIGGNLISEVLIFIAGVIATAIYTWIRLFGAKRFWKPFLEAPIIPVVLTDKPGTQPRSPRKISITDVQAYANIQSALERLGAKAEIQPHSEASLLRLTKGAFISLGGPKANGVTRDVILKLANHLPVRFDEQNLCFIYKGINYGSVKDAAGLVTTDIGLIVRVPCLDPSAVSSFGVLVAFGLHGHGTGQAVNAITTNKPLRNRLEKYYGVDSWALLKFTFSDHNPIDCDIIDVGGFSRVR